MSFLLRAALVIGALSYLAATRGDPAQTVGTTGPGTVTAALAEALPAGAQGGTPLDTAGSLAAAWGSLPADARQRLTQEAVSELGRRIAPAAASRDTLADADRKAAWRGAEAR